MDDKRKEDLTKEFRSLAIQDEEEEGVSPDIYFAKIKELIKVMNDKEFHGFSSEPDLQGTVFTEMSDYVIEIIAILCAKGYLNSLKLAHELFHVNGGPSLVKKALEAYAGKEYCKENRIAWRAELGCSERWMEEQYHEPIPLCAAIYYGQTHVVEYLLSIGTLDESNSHRGCLPLNISCERGYLEITKLLIDHGADWRQSDFNGFDCLYMASCQGFVSIVQYLIDVGAQVTEGGYSFVETAVGGACFYSGQLFSVTQVEDHYQEDQIYHYRVYSLMLSGEPSPNPLAEKVESNYVETIRLLLQHGEPEDLLYMKEIWEPQQSAFMEAAKGGSSQVLDLLLQLGSAGGVNDVAMGYTRKNEWPLSSACRMGNLEAVRFLISNGAFIKFYDFYAHYGDQVDPALLSNTEPIEQAALCTRETGPDILSLLIQNGAALGTPTFCFKVMNNAACCNNVEGLKILLAALGRDPLSTCEDLDIYCRSKIVENVCRGFSESDWDVDYTQVKVQDMKKKMKILKLLLEAGFGSDRALYGFCDGKIRRPLEILDFLISRGGDANQEVEDGDTPLNAACRHLDLDLIDHLLRHGADLNKRGKRGWTPLQVLASTKYREIDHCFDYSKEDTMRYLCEERGANVHVVCPETGQTLLDMACRNYEKRKFKLLMYFLTQGLSLQSDTLSIMHQGYSWHRVLDKLSSILLLDNAIATGTRPGPAGRTMLNLFGDSKQLQIYQYSSMPHSLKKLHGAGFLVHVFDEMEQKIMASNDTKSQNILKIIQEEMERVPSLQELSVWAARHAIGPGLVSMRKMDHLLLTNPATEAFLFRDIIDEKHAQTLNNYITKIAKREFSKETPERNRPERHTRHLDVRVDGYCHLCNTDSEETYSLERQQEMEEIRKWVIDFMEQCQK